AAGMRFSALPGWLRFKKLTAVSAILLLLGLAIWFSKTESLVSAATFCYSRFRFQLPSRRQRGASSISSSHPLSTSQLQLFSFRLPVRSSAAQWLPLLLPGGRGF
ncbi:hypothetical protein LY474_34790, partial [Myxococcus stipitatus]|uniref:hypothetical protein n=2 Tax=Myxococcus stipitatus TaxID=83455 RepID=UPI001F44A1BB